MVLQGTSHLNGKIVSGPYYGDRGDSFYIGVDDGTGRLNAKAYGSTAVAVFDDIAAPALYQYRIRLASHVATVPGTSLRANVRHRACRSDAVLRTA